MRLGHDAATPEKIGRGLENAETPSLFSTSIEYRRFALISFSHRAIATTTPCRAYWGLRAQPTTATPTREAPRARESSLLCRDDAQAVRAAPNSAEAPGNARKYHENKQLKR